MGCKTPSVERVANKTAKAKEQIDKLQSMIESQEKANKVKFYEQIKNHLASAGISDAREISYNSSIKTEYTSEFSLDKIANVVTSSLNAVKEATDPKITNPATNPKAIDAYVDVVNTVAEAAKSSSTAAASISFSMNRLSPGMFAFLFASSINIQDDETFGKEAVTTTAIYYRFIQSIQDLKEQGAFDAARIEVALNLASYEKFKTLQVSLIDQLASGKIDIDTYTKLDTIYASKATELKSELDSVKVRSIKSAMAPRETCNQSIHQELIHSSIKKLASMGEIYQTIVERTKERIATGYFHEENNPVSI